MLNSYFAELEFLHFFLLSIHGGNLQIYTNSLTNGHDKCCCWCLLFTGACTFSNPHTNWTVLCCVHSLSPSLFRLTVSKLSVTDCACDFQSIQRPVEHGVIRMREKEMTANIVPAQARCNMNLSCKKLSTIRNLVQSENDTRCLRCVNIQCFWLTVFSYKFFSHTYTHILHEVFFLVFVVATLEISGFIDFTKKKSFF
jgi:hypothetical protein